MRRIGPGKSKRALIGARINRAIVVEAEPVDRLGDARDVSSSHEFLHAFGQLGRILGEDLRIRIKPIPACVERSEEHTSELQSLRHLVCSLLLYMEEIVI